MTVVIVERSCSVRFGRVFDQNCQSNTVSLHELRKHITVKTQTLFTQRLNTSFCINNDEVEAL